MSSGAEEMNRRSVCAVTISSSEIAFAGLDERTNSLFCDKFVYSRESLYTVIESVRGGCNVEIWLIHPKHKDNPIVSFLHSSNPDDAGDAGDAGDAAGSGAGKRSVVEVVKAKALRPEVAEPSTMDPYTIRAQRGGDRDQTRPSAP